LPAVGDNLNPSPESIREILAGASQVCDLLLNDNIVGRLRQITDYLTLGVDSWKSKVSTTHNEISERHAELVCLVDLRSGTRRWTGKFYPTSKQAATIMRLPDLKSHFVNLDDQKAMVLGCHDMTVFNPRSEAAARGWRQEVSERFRGMAKSYKPVLVLHHPHTAVKSVRERSRDLA